MSQFDLTPMRTEDIPAVLQFCRQAGWNQLDSDWRRLLEHDPGGCFVARSEQQIVGSVTATRYSVELGWIGMMLVKPAFRRRGIASSLMKAAIDYLESSGVQTIKLDATPEGALVYQHLNFQREYTYQRCSRTVDASQNPVATDPRNIEFALTELANLDRNAFGTSRQQMLSLLAAISESVFTGDGFGMLRGGYVAEFLGPVVAESADTAQKIVRQLLARCRTGRKVFWDVASGNPRAAQLAREYGFQPERELIRMYRGETFEPQRPELQYALAGPSMG